MLFCALAMVSLDAVPIQQVRLLGAKQVTQQLQSAPHGGATEVKQWRFLARVQNLIDVSPRMPAHGAANLWLDLLEQGRTIPEVGYNGKNSLPLGSLETLIEALPRPETWPIIAGIVAKRPATVRNQLLLILFARLQGNDDEVLRLCERFDRRKQRPGGDGMDMRQARHLALVRLRDLHGQLEAIKRGRQIGPIPDLVDLMGPDRARPTILDLFRNGGSGYEVDGRASPMTGRSSGGSHTCFAGFRPGPCIP